MWARVFEWCADIFGLTTHSRLHSLVALLGALFLFGLFLGARFGWDGLLPPALLLALAMGSALQVSNARRQLWRTSCLRLDDGRQSPSQEDDPKLLAPTAFALRRLAEAIDAVRRGRYSAAEEIRPLVDRQLLRREEIQLFDAVRAMISLGLGDDQRAAQQAITALPTGSDELDTCLGRAVIADAWGNEERLRAIDTAWGNAGIDTAQQTSLARLQHLVRLRIDTSVLDAMTGPEARALVDEARAIGDDALAAELEARGRPTAYR